MPDEVDVTRSSPPQSGVVASAEVGVKTLSDAPAQRDLLGYGDYCNALVSIIVEPLTETPLTIGVFGEWGSGKTTLLEMVKQELAEEGLRGVSGRSKVPFLRRTLGKLRIGRSSRLQSIWADVWQFRNEEDIWAAFLQSLLLKVRGEMSLSRRFLFSLRLLIRRINAAAVLALALRLLIVVVPLSLPLLNLTSPAQLESLPYVGVTLASAGTIVSTVLGWFLLLKPLVTAVREQVKVDLTMLVKSSPLRERVSALDQFVEYFEDMTRSLVGKQGRMVVFVDDLDRCSPEHGAQVLDAIKLFLSVSNCVYLLGLDRGIIEQAIRARFNNYENATEEAVEYIDKIIQLPFDLPPLSGEQMRDLVVGLDAKLPQGEDSVNVFAHGQEANPRKIKRTINVFLLLWELSRKRQLHTAIQAVRLAKIVVIQNSYRELYKKLIVLPDHLGSLEAYFRQTQSGDPPTTPLPDDLTPFISEIRLKRLLTLHPPKNEGANFTKQENGEYKSVPDNVIRAYIDLTSSVSREPRMLDGVDLHGNDLRGANLSGKSMRGANLSRASLDMADLSRADLSQANLEGTVLTRADLSNTNLSGTNLRAADLSSANLTMAEGLTQEQIDRANTNRETMLSPPLVNRETVARVSSDRPPERAEVLSNSIDRITKRTVIEKVAEQAGLTTNKSQRYLEAFTEVVAEALKNGESVQITGFGKFYVQEREARQGINPQTKQRINIPASKVPKFTAGSVLKDAIK